MALLKALLFFALIFLALLLTLEAGRWLRRHRNRVAGGEEPPGFGLVSGAVFGLMGLLLGFSFSAAGGRFETRRQLVVDEANAIGTAWLRLDVLPDSVRGPMQADFRRYVDERLAGYAALPDTVAAKAAFARAEAVQQGIWARGVASTKGAPTTAPAMLLLPALNDMFDMASTRKAALRAHLPSVVFALLFGLVLFCGVLAGYGMTDGGPRNWLYTLSFAAVFVVALYVIVDYEFPRWGLINLRVADQPMLEVRASMGD